MALCSSTKIHHNSHRLRHKYLSQISLADRAASYRYCQCWRDSRINLSLCLGSPKYVRNGFIGVIVVGESIRAQETALSLLLVLLLTVGGLALLSAGLGGLFLANRALAPARLAWENQQRFIADASHELRTPLTLLCRCRGFATRS